MSHQPIGPRAYALRLRFALGKRMKNKVSASVWIGVFAFAAGFWISHLLAEQRITDFAERIRLNEVHFFAVDAESGERIRPSTGYASKGLFGSVTLPGMMRSDKSGSFQMSWVDIEDMEGYIEPYAGGERYSTALLRDLATTTSQFSGRTFLEPIEIRFEKAGAQPASDGNAEKPRREEREP